jgi:gliding motility-associated-like protein
MYKLILVFCFQLPIYIVGAQTLNNKVPNASFEEYKSCPDSICEIFEVPGWFNICNCCIDYFNTCATGTSFGVPQNDWGYQYARTGYGYSQIAAWLTIVNYREYIGSKLLKPLQQGKEYFIEFNVSIGESASSAASDQVGLLLTDSTINCPGMSLQVLSNYHPQIVSPKGFVLNDSINWTKISGSYIAQGGEEYLTIGIFVPNDSLTWIYRHYFWVLGCTYFIDDVYIYESDHPPGQVDAGADTVICLGDSVELGTTDFLDYKYLWTNAEGMTDSTARPWVYPMHATSYYLKQTDFLSQIAYDTITITIKNCEPRADAGRDVVICKGDSVQLGSTDNLLNSYAWTTSQGESFAGARPWVMPLQPECYILKQTDKYDSISYDSICIMLDECIKPLIIPNAFTPNGDQKNDYLAILNPGYLHYTLRIFNRWGSEVYRDDENNFWDGKHKGNDVPDGVYYYQISVYLIDGKELNYQGGVHVLR